MGNLLPNLELVFCCHCWRPVWNAPDATDWVYVYEGDEYFHRECLEVFEGVVI